MSVLAIVPCLGVLPRWEQCCSLSVIVRQYQDCRASETLPPPSTVMAGWWEAVRSTALVSSSPGQWPTGPMLCSSRV
jgi:hypothetical protein